MDIKNLIEELEYILEIFKKPIPVKDLKIHLEKRIQDIKNLIETYYQKEKKLFDRGTIERLNIIFLVLKEQKKLRAIRVPKGSKEGLSNISEVCNKLEIQKTERENPYEPKGMSVTATARRDLDLSKPKIFHKNDCEWLRNVPYGRGIIFKNRDEAIKENYRPCKICNP